MISDMLQPAKEGFVWTWLPDMTEPVVAGRIDLVNGLYQFTYGRSYLERENAIPLYEPELPLRAGVHMPRAPHVIAGCLRDGAPDNWGRRVIYTRLIGRHDRDMDTDRIDELSYMLLSGSDRTGALDFQTSSGTYQPRLAEHATLEMMMTAASHIDRGMQLPTELDEAIHHGTSIGGARPKVLLSDGDRKLIAKFSSSRDPHNIVGAEFIGMTLAHRVGINVATVEMRQVAGKDVLLVDRFDRIRKPDGWARRHMVSALTMMELDERSAHHGSYEDLAGILRRRGSTPADTLIELYRRMVFNILIGNTDDHARNHAAFWDGRHLTLTPAYDLEPRPRMGRAANQAIRVHRSSRESRIAVALDAAPSFGIPAERAIEIAIMQIETIQNAFNAIVAQAGVTEIDRNILANRAILNPYIFEGAPTRIARLERPL